MTGTTAGVGPALLGLALVACSAAPSGQAPNVVTESGSASGDPVATTSASTTAPSVPADSTSTGGTTSGVTTGGPGSSGSDGPGFPNDVPLIPDAGGIPGACDGVDFLFVVDNSISMEIPQATVAANFGSFIEGIQSTLEGVNSYHVGVVTTDAYVENSAQCEELGGLVVGTASGACGPYSEGNNFMTEADDLEASFTCAARVGASGLGFELPMLAMQTAIDGTLDGPGLCNEGFIRDNAPLVIILITDESDGPGDPEGDLTNPLGGPTASPGDPTSWFEDVVAIKGVETNVAVVSFVNFHDGPCPPMPQPPIFDGQNIKDFTEMFTYGVVGGICEPDYSNTFEEAITVVEAACSGFTPPAG